jgi:hypothetical protein
MERFEKVQEKLDKREQEKAELEAQAAEERRALEEQERKLKEEQEVIRNKRIERCLGCPALKKAYRHNNYSGREYVGDACIFEDEVTFVEIHGPGYLCASITSEPVFKDIRDIKKCPANIE